MDERLTLFLSIAGGVGFLGLVGGLFGALAGLLARINGGAPGGIVGTRVLRAVERVLKTPLSPPQAGALVGACDGASFLGGVGGLLGLAAGYGEWLSIESLLIVFFAIAALAALAVHFGLLAYGFLRAGVRAFGGACAGAVAGVFLGAWILGGIGVFIGGEIGALVGLSVGILSGRRVQPRALKETWDQFRMEERES